MVKTVIIESDSQKRRQIRQTLEQELMSWLEPGRWGVQRVVTEVDFASSLEEYLGCNPEEVYHLEKLSVESFVNDMKRSEDDIPQWIRMNTHFLGEKLNDNAPDIVIGKDDFFIENIPFLKKKGSEHRYMFFQAADGDHVSLLKNVWFMLRVASSPVLNFLLTDDSMQTFPANKDGMSNYLPYSWKSHFPDNKAHVIVRMNAVLDDVEGFAENENLSLQYDELNFQVVQNLHAVFPRIKGRWIYLYREKWPIFNENVQYIRFTQELLALIEKASCFSSDFSQISISLSSKSSGEFVKTFYLAGNQPTGTVQQSQILKGKDWTIFIDYHIQRPLRTSLTGFEEYVKAWGQMEFEYCFRANKDLIDSINWVLKGNAERLGLVIDSICEDLEKSSLDKKFKEEHLASLEYIQQKFQYIAGFTDCYGVGNCCSVGSIVDQLNKYQLVFQCLDEGKKINVHIDADDATRKQEVWLPDNGICCLTNIIEAVIRNTIKHEHNPNGKYDFRLSITQGGECLFFWEASDKTTEGMRIVRKSLNNPLVFDDGHIDYTSLGLKELRASMRYLYDGILSFYENHSDLLYVDPYFSIVEIDDGWGYRFNLHTSELVEASYLIGKEMDALRTASLVALSAIMARNFSHNIGSHAILSLINRVEKEIYRVELESKNSSIQDKDEKLKVLGNLKNVYEYIQNKSDFLSSFAFAGDGVILHSESVYDIWKEYQKYAYVFSKLASASPGLDVIFSNFGNPVSEEDNLCLSLPESGILAFFNLIEMLLCHTRFSGKNSSMLCLQFLQGGDDGIEVYMIWMKEATIHPLLYQNREFQDVALYLQGVDPYNWGSKRNHVVWGELTCAFQLQKAKDFFFVEDTTENKGKFYGFDWESLDALQTKLQDGLVIPHEFLIFVDVPNRRKEDFLCTVPRHQLPFRIIDMKSGDIVMDQLEFLAKAWRKYAEQHLFGERLLEPEVINEDYDLIDINDKQPYSGNHGLGYDPDGKLYYYNEGASSAVQKRSLLYQCTHSHELTKATFRKKRPDIWADMDSSKRNKWLWNKYALFDYTTLPVVIIDERIQSYGSKENLYETWSKVHVYVPEEDIYGKLDTIEDLDTVVEEYLKIVSDQLENVGLRGEFCAVVFHESLLYSWVNKQENQENSIVSYLQELKKQFPQIHVYLMTGRGKSQYIKQDEENKIRFVQFTPMYTVCRKESIDKLKMYNLLMSARK